MYIFVLSFYIPPRPWVLLHYCICTVQNYSAQNTLWGGPRPRFEPGRSKKAGTLTTDHIVQYSTEHRTLAIKEDWTYSGYTVLRCCYKYYTKHPYNLYKSGRECAHYALNTCSKGHHTVYTRINLRQKTGEHNIICRIKTHDSKTIKTNNTQ